MKNKRGGIQIYFLGILLLLLAQTGHAQTVITSQPTNQYAVNGSTATFSVRVTGVGPFTYRWLFNGTNLPFTNIITTVAGSTANTGFSGDGGFATNAMLSDPEGVAVDQAGNIFISDAANNRIRKVDTNGIITTVAGSSLGFSGDGGMATNAQLRSLTVMLEGIASDGAGNFLVSDCGNNRVRKIDTNGIITTVAGNGLGTFAGDGVAVTNTSLTAAGIVIDGSGNLFIADRANKRIRKIDTNGIITTVAGTNAIGFAGDGGPASVAKLQLPMGVSVDGFGNLIIADTGNNRIRKVDINGVITTIAGNNSSGYFGDGVSALATALNQPSHAIPDAFGNLYIADMGNSRIRKVDASGIISTVAGTNLIGYSGDGGAAANASLNKPLDLALDSYGNLFIADSQNNRIRKVDLAGSPILQLKNVTTNNAGDYQAVITSPSGSVTSSVVSLTVFLPPSISVQPVSISAPVGGSANFNVAAINNPPLGYQWFTSSGRTATAESILSGGQVLMAFILDGGQGYVSTPQVHFTGGGGSGAVGTARVLAGRVISINMVNLGSGYTSDPTVQIDPPSTINTVLTDETNASLTLPSVTSANSTNYLVVVTNSYGSVTSSAAYLIVFLAPQSFAAQYLGTGLQLQFNGTPNYPYILQSTTNLIPPIVWKSVRTNSADNSGIWQFTDNNLNADQKYYRAMGQ